MAIIEVEHARKVFQVVRKDPGLGGAVQALFRPRLDTVVAVDDISFRVEAGEMVGYIGVNGAGKSTTIKMLTGILVPTGGRIRVMGRDPYRQRVANAAEIGVVFGQRTQLWWDLALIESLNLIGRIYQVEPARFRSLMDEFAETLELKDLLQVPIRNMSLGRAGVLVLAVLSGGAIFIALNLITSVSAFWIVESIPVTRAVFETCEFAKFPLTIYPRVISILLTWLVPYGLASFYPASYLLGREPGVMAWAALPVSLVLLYLGCRLWLVGLRHYTSTGS